MISIGAECEDRAVHNFSNLKLDTADDCNNKPMAGWTEFEFIPQSNSHKAQSHVVETQPNNFESFFSTFQSEINKLNLLEKDMNAVYKLCIELTKKVNELNTALIDESQFEPKKVKNIGTNGK